MVTVASTRRATPLPRRLLAAGYSPLFATSAFPSSPGWPFPGSGRPGRRSRAGGAWRPGCCRGRPGRIVERALLDGLLHPLDALLGQFDGLLPLADFPVRDAHADERLAVAAQIGGDVFGRRAFQAAERPCRTSRRRRGGRDPGSRGWCRGGNTAGPAGRSKPGDGFASLAFARYSAAASPYFKALSLVGPHLADLHGVVERHAQLPLELGLLQRIAGGGDQFVARGDDGLRRRLGIDRAAHADVGGQRPGVDAEHHFPAARPRSSPGRRPRPRRAPASGPRPCPSPSTRPRRCRGRRPDGRRPALPWPPRRIAGCGSDVKRIGQLNGLGVERDGLLVVGLRAGGQQIADQAQRPRLHVRPLLAASTAFWASSMASVKRPSWARTWAWVTRYWGLSGSRRTASAAAAAAFSCCSVAASTRLCSQWRGHFSGSSSNACSRSRRLRSERSPASSRRAARTARP